MRLPSCCRKKEPPEPIYEFTDPRHHMQQMDKGLGPKTAMETCLLLLKFPLSYRRTKTSPIKLCLENTALQERLLLQLTRIAANHGRKEDVKKHAYSFWSSFKSGERAFPTTPDIETNKLETWIHQHNYTFPIKRRGKINDFAYLIDPKATLKHLNVFKITSIHRILEDVLEKALWADQEEKRIAKEEELLATQNSGANSDSDSDSDDEDSINSSTSNKSTDSPKNPEQVYQDALDDLEYDLEQATEHANKMHDEWGNKVPDDEKKQREKICENIRRKMDKVKVRMGGAKFDMFRKCEKKIQRVKRRFERQMGEVIKIAEARRQSRIRAKRRLQYFDEEQEWFQRSSRYDDAPTSKPKAMRWNISLKPISKKFDRPWVDDAKSSFSWRRRAMLLVSKPFWEAKTALSPMKQKKMDEEEERNRKKYELTDTTADEVEVTVAVASP